MSSTIMSASSDHRLERFFYGRLLKAAEQYRREGRLLLAGNPDEQLPTYYCRRSRTRMSKADFENGSCSSPAELEQVLATFWREQGFDELAELAPQLANLAERLKDSQQESDEVSPFVYVMY